MSQKNTKNNFCYNCHHVFDEKQPNDFCPACGQKNTHSKVSFKVLLVDFVQNYLTFDSKFFRSLFYLTFYPGFISRTFNEGKRMRFILPIRLFLIVGIAYVSIVSQLFVSQYTEDFDITRQDLDSIYYAINGQSDDADTTIIQNINTNDSLNIPIKTEKQDSINQEKNKSDKQELAQARAYHHKNIAYQIQQTLKDKDNRFTKNIITRTLMK